MLHKLHHNVDRLFLCADGIELNQLWVTEAFKNHCFCKEGFRGHGARPKGLDGHWSGVVPDTLQDSPNIQHQTNSAS